MTINIESELLQLVTNATISSSPEGPSAFLNPIASSYSPSKLITDPSVLYRACYNQVPQDIQKDKVPYLYWLGPFNYDKRQTAGPSNVIKKADFWFYCTHFTTTRAMAWVNDIEAAIDLVTFPVTLSAVKLTAAIFQGKYPMVEDQVIKTAQEFPLARACIGYRFGFGPSGT